MGNQWSSTIPHVQRGNVLNLAKILVQFEPDVRLGIEVEEALLGEELLDLFPAHRRGQAVRGGRSFPQVSVPYQ